MFSNILVKKRAILIDIPRNSTPAPNLIDRVLARTNIRPKPVPNRSQTGPSNAETPKLTIPSFKITISSTSSNAI